METIGINYLVPTFAQSSMLGGGGGSQIFGT